MEGCIISCNPTIRAPSMLTDIDSRDFILISKMIFEALDLPSMAFEKMLEEIL